MLGVKAPKAPKPLPKALSVDDAVQLAEFSAEEADPLDGGARCGDRGTALWLRPARGRTGGAGRAGSAHRAGWVDLQAGEAHVLGKGSKRRTVPVGARRSRP